jgi:DNA replication protein DnaC
VNCWCPVVGCGEWFTDDDRYRDNSRRYRDHLGTVHGWTAEAINEHERCRTRDERLRRLAYGRSRMSGWTLDTFPHDDLAGRRALNAARAWLDQVAQPRVYIYGPTGTGKSGLALGMARHWIEDFGDEAVFANVRALLAEQRASFVKAEPDDEWDDGPTTAERLLDLCDTGLAVLDDLGAERPTEYALDTVARIVEHLHDEDVWLIVTTNYAPRELAQRLGHADHVVGQRIVSRLIEGALKINLHRADLRMRSARADEVA